MRIILAAVSLLTLVGLADAASAQTAGNTNGTANASNSVVVNAYTGTGNGTTSTTGSAGTGATTGATTGAGTTGTAATTTTNVHYSGHEWSTPAVQGGYFAGANPCLVGIGASGAGGPIGLSFTFGRSDQGCQRRSDAAAWHALGHDEVAIARMCQDDDNKAAFESVGFACPQTRMAAIAASASASPLNHVAAPVQQAPDTTQQTPPIPALTTPAAGPKVAANQPGWCSTVTGSAERLQYKQVCGF